MDILICVNKMYLDKAMTMLYSIRENNSDPCTVYLLSHSLSKDDICRFEIYLRNKLSYSLFVIDVNGAGFEDMPIGSRHFSVEMYFRILAQFLLPENLDRVLWLDADIIVLNSLENFYYQDFEDMLYIACPDSGAFSDEVRRIKSRVGIKEDHVYFNSGVLLLNLRELRKQTDRESILNVAAELSPRLEYPDQDILNYLYFGKVKYADNIYNYQVLQTKKLQAETLNRVVILHYAGKWKPWNFRTIERISWEYWRVVCKQGDYVSCVVAYVKSFFYKIKRYVLSKYSNR